jgi:hypothetical protein
VVNARDCLTLYFAGSERREFEPRQGPSS